MITDSKWLEWSSFASSTVRPFSIAHGSRVEYNTLLYVFLRNFRNVSDILDLQIFLCLNAATPVSVLIWLRKNRQVTNYFLLFFIQEPHCGGRQNLTLPDFTVIPHKAYRISSITENDIRRDENLSTITCINCNRHIFSFLYFTKKTYTTTQNSNTSA